MTKIWKKIKSAHNKLTGTATILFKYRDFSRSLVSSQQVITAVSNNTFTFNNAVTIAEVGDEVTVLGGTGAGQVRHIISKNATSKIFTIDENWDANPTANYSMLEIASWKKMSEKSAITNKEKDGKALIFSQRGIENQVKLVMYHNYGDSNIELSGLEVGGEIVPE